MKGYKKLTLADVLQSFAYDTYAANKEKVEAMEKANRLKERELDERDRVDISRREYESMKEQIKKLTEDNNLYRQIIDHSKIKDFYDYLTPETEITTRTLDDPVTLDKVFTISYRIPLYGVKVKAKEQGFIAPMFPLNKN